MTNNYSRDKCVFFAILLLASHKILAADTAAIWTYEVIDKLPHPYQPFTQGLEIVNNQVFESSGLQGRSYLLRWSLTEKPIPIKKVLSPMIFAEGITFLDDKGYLLTWKNQRGFIFDPATLQISGSFNYSGEGWGLTNDGKSLIMSNGSSELRWFSPKNFQTEKAITVTLNGEPLKKLNELEWANNLIFSNIWQSNSIVAINPQSGSVIGQIDFSELAKNESNNPDADVLNGIAYDQKNNSYLVTGKNWQWIYRIKILQK